MQRTTRLKTWVFFMVLLWSAVSADQTDCVLTISKTYFQRGHVLVVSSPKPTTEDSLLGGALLERLHRAARFPIFSTSPEERPGVTGTNTAASSPALHFIMVVRLERCVQDMEDQIKTLTNLTVWNSRGEFIVLVDGSSPATAVQETVRGLLSALWEAMVHNVVVVMATSEDLTPVIWNTSTRNSVGFHGSSNLYTWFPYDGSNCGGVGLQNIVLVDKCLNSGRFEQSALLFPDKVARNGNRCELRVSTFELPPAVMDMHIEEIDGHSIIDFGGGVEVKLVKLIAETMNLSLKFLPPPVDKWGNRDNVSGTWINGIWGDVFNKKAHLALGVTTLNEEFFKDFDLSKVYLQMINVWAVPRPKPLPRWKNLITIFSPQVWLMLLVTTLLVPLVFWAVASTRKKWHLEEHESYQSLGSDTMLLMSVIVNVPFPNIPHSGFLRSFLLVWFLFCFIMNSVYLSKLVSALYSTPMEKPMETFEELLASPLPMGMHPVTYATLPNTTSTRRISEKYYPNTDVNVLRYMLAKHQNVSFWGFFVN